MHQAAIAAFLNQKGGVGKTTSVANIGAGLAILGKKVLLVDLDPQGHLTTFLGIESTNDATVYDVLRGNAGAADAFVRQRLAARVTMDGQDSPLAMTVLPADLSLCDAEAALSLAPGRYALLRRALARVSPDFDHILIDCPPSLGLLSTNALVAASRVYIPIQAEFLAMESLESLLNWIESLMEERNPELKIGGLIATRFDGRKVLNRSVVASLAERFGIFFMSTMIRENIALAESPSVGKDIFAYRPKSHGAEDYLNLTLELLGQTRANDTAVESRPGTKSTGVPERVAL